MCYGMCYGQRRLYKPTHERFGGSLITEDDGNIGSGGNGVLPFDNAPSREFLK